MHIAYASTNFQKVVCIETELSSSPHVNVQILTTCCFQSCWYLKLLLTASVDSCVEIKRVPLQWHNQFWETLEAGAGKQGLECATKNESHSQLFHTRWECQSSKHAHKIQSQGFNQPATICRSQRHKPDAGTHC